MKPALPCQHSQSLFIACAVVGLLGTVTNLRAQTDGPEIKSASVHASPLIRVGAQGETHALVTTLDSGGVTNITLRLSSPAWPEPRSQTLEKLAPGAQDVTVEVPAFAGPIQVSVELATADWKRAFGPFEVVPPRRWTVYLTQHTHTDIGYTRPQIEILPEHLRYIDYALDYCDLTDGYPDDAKFRWTCETSWAVREYLRGRPARQIERLKQRVRDGRIEVCGLLLNMSEIAPEPALAALVRPLRELNEVLGTPVRTAMQNDVNGAGWCLPDFFHGLGIRYLNMGINQTRSILPFDKPTCFWWESPSGKRVLAYRSDHYMTANFWGLETGHLAKVRPGVDKYLRGLERRGYPFDRVGVQFSGYFTDNSPPSTAACDLVRAWNQQFVSPRLRLATAQEFLGWAEKEHATELAVHRQAWPDWWTDGFGSAARETAAARETETAMQINYALLAMAAVAGAPIRPDTLQRAAAIQDDLLFYHEHTYGAAESISDPLAENTQVQWGQKASYVWSAVMAAALLREEALGLAQEFIPRAAGPGLAVFNTLNWPRSGLVRVFIDHEILPPDREFKILDGAEALPAQDQERRAEGTYWAVWVRDVPAFGFKLLRLQSSAEPRSPPPAAPPGPVLENAFYKLTVDPAKGGIVSWVDKASGRELVDPQAPWTLGQCVYETMPANREMKPEVFRRTSVRNVEIRPGANGPVWRSLQLAADLDGAATNRGLHAEFRLYDTEKRLELHFRLRKLPVPTPEAVYVALPFQMPEGHLLYEAQGGLVTPGDDQIPGSSSDWQTLQSFLAIRGDAGQIILGSAQAPLVQLGDFNLGKWQPVTRVERPHVYSWVMNNYWFTNFRAEQAGEFRWHYYLTSTPDAGRSAAMRFGWGSRVPLVARVLPPQPGATAPGRAAASALNLEPANVLVVEARPAREGRAVVLHLRETEGRSVTLGEADLHTARRLRRVDEVNVLEEVVQPDIRSLALQPNEVKFVRLEFE